MRISNLKKLEAKDLIVFDLDGTLTKTKSALDLEMSLLITRLLMSKKVAVIGGGKYAIFQEQFLRHLKTPKFFFKDLSLFPTTSTAYYRYHNGWKKVYALILTKSQKQSIRRAFKEALQEVHHDHPKKVYGKVLEDRRTQMTFSAIGQDVVAILGKKKGVAMKEAWLRKNKDLKMKIAKAVQRRLPDLEVRAAGFTSIDVTKKGIDKAYGIHQIQKHLQVPIKKMLFIGDAIFPGGNDYAIVKTGVDYIPVAGPEETKKIIRRLIQK